MKSGSADHCVSNLLVQEEAELVVSLLGNRCQALAMGVAQLFLTDPPYHSNWRKHESGVVCLVKDNQRRSYFFRLYCLFRRQLIWEHEVYSSLEYLTPRPFLHTFEGEDCIVAFNFANDEDARHLRAALLERLEALKRRLDRRSRQSTSNSSQHSHSQMHSASSTDNHLANGMVPVAAKQKPHIPPSSGRRKEKDSKRRLTKADIGLPQDFRHVSHVGWDPNKGFDVDNVEDPQLKQFFEKAGVSDSQLQDRETRQFIYDFINRHGGLDAVKSELVPCSLNAQSAGPPPVPARTAPSTPGLSHQARCAPPPPPPPSRSGPLPPPPLPSQPPATGPPQPPPVKPSPPPIPAPPSVGAPPPPPPPPPPTMSREPPAAPPPPPMAAGVGLGAPPAKPDPRSALMESIRSGKQLKHVEVENKRLTGGDTRNDLLDQIRQGVELKSVQAAPRPQNSSHHGLASALARALAERSRVIHSDSSGSSDEENEEEDEWED